MKDYPIDFNEQLSIIKKQLKYDGESEESIKTTVEIIKDNYSKCKKFLYKRYQFNGVNRIGVVVGIDCFTEQMIRNDIDLDKDITLIVKLEENNTSDYSFIFSKNIYKEL